MVREGRELRLELQFFPGSQHPALTCILVQGKQCSLDSWAGSAASRIPTRKVLSGPVTLKPEAESALQLWVQQVQLHSPNPGPNTQTPNPQSIFEHFSQPATAFRGSRDVSFRPTPRCKIFSEVLALPQRWDGGTLCAEVGPIRRREKEDPRFWS